MYEAGQEFQPIDFNLIDHLKQLLSVELQKTNLFNINKSLIPNYIITDLISKNYDTIDFCHPAVIKLLNEDNANNTDFLQTLKYYLYFIKAPAKAAEALCIHKNTLFYRVNTIKQLTGITLD